jgi:hypothetical protein
MNRRAAGEPHPLVERGTGRPFAVGLDVQLQRRQITDKELDGASTVEAQTAF